MSKFVSIVHVVPVAIAMVMAPVVTSVVRAQAMPEPLQADPDVYVPQTPELRPSTHIDEPPAPPAPLPEVVVGDPSDNAPRSHRALGLRAGAFIFYPSIVSGYIYTDNVVGSGTNARAEHGFSIAPGVHIDSDWSRHSLRASLNGEYVFYSRKSTHNTKDLDLRVDGRIDVLRGTTVDLSMGYELSKDGGGANRPLNGTEIADITTYRGGAVVTHRFNRLALALRGGIERLNYSDVRLSGGGIQTNGDRDYTQYNAGLRASYELGPALTSFMETSYLPRRYKQKVDDNGLRRDSEGYEALVGGVFDFDSIWQGEAAVGYGWRFFDDPAFKDTNSVLFRAVLNWQPSRITRVRFTADSDIGETSVSTAAAVYAYSAGVRIDHSFREHLIGFGAVNFTFRDFAGSSQQENLLEASTGLEYFLTRQLSLIGQYEFERLNTNLTQGDYTVNTVSLKVKVKR